MSAVTLAVTWGLSRDGVLSAFLAAFSIVAGLVFIEEIGYQRTVRSEFGTFLAQLRAWSRDVLEWSDPSTPVDDAGPTELDPPIPALVPASVQQVMGAGWSKRVLEKPDWTELSPWRVPSWLPPMLVLGGFVLMAGWLAYAPTPDQAILLWAQYVIVFFVLFVTLLWGWWLERRASIRWILIEADRAFAGLRSALPSDQLNRVKNELPEWLERVLERGPAPYG